MKDAKEALVVVKEEKMETDKFYRKFFNMSGSIFYCLSALSIILGLSQVVTPIFKESNLLKEKIFCIGALNLYEILLICILLVLVLWKKVKDDAVSLVIIMGLFFAVSGILIGTIANTHLYIALGIGVISIILAGAKIFTIRKFVSVYLGALLLLGIVLILIWNYLISYAMAYVLDTDESLVSMMWRFGWLLMFAGVFFMLLQGIFPAEGNKNNISAFINSPGMGWIFSLEILITSLVHQYVIAYIFDLPVLYGDYLPVILLMFFMLMEFLRLKIKAKIIDSIIVFTPLMFIIAGIFSNTLPKDTGFYMLLWSVGGLLALCAGVLILLGLLQNDKRFFIYTIPYFMGILVVGVSSSPDPLYGYIQWKFALLLLGSAMGVVGILFRKPALLLLCVILGANCLVRIPEVLNFLLLYSLPGKSVIFLIMGAGILIIYNYFKNEIPLFFGFLGAVLFAIGAQGIAGELVDFRMLFSSAFIIVVSVLILRKLHNRFLACITGLPLLWFIYLNLQVLHGWHYIILSFLLLIGGGLLSLRKVEKRKYDN